MLALNLQSLDLSLDRDWTLAGSDLPSTIEVLPAIDGDAAM